MITKIEKVKDTFSPQIECDWCGEVIQDETAYIELNDGTVLHKECDLAVYRTVERPVPLVGEHHRGHTDEEALIDVCVRLPQIEKEWEKVDSEDFRSFDVTPESWDWDIAEAYVDLMYSKCNVELTTQCRLDTDIVEVKRNGVIREFVVHTEIEVKFKAEPVKDKEAEKRKWKRYYERARNNAD